MRLPGRVKTGVQRLGRRDVGAELATGQAIASAAGAIAGDLNQVHQVMTQRKNRSQEREAGLAMSEAISQFETQYGGRDYYNSDEIPDGIQVRRTEKTVSNDGVVTESPRNNIPAYEAYPDLYRQQAEAAAEAAASKIDDERLRTEWLTNTRTKINQQYTNRALAANRKQEDFVNRQLNAQIGAAVDSGQYAEAKALATDISDPVIRQEAISKIEVQQEIDSLDLEIASRAMDYDDVDMKLEIAKTLTSDDYTGNLTAGQRRAKAQALRASANQNEARLDAERREHEARMVSDTWLAIDEGSTSVDESTIDELFTLGAINGTTRTAMTRAYRSAQSRILDAQRNQQMIADISTSGAGIDPKNKDMRDAVNSRYDTYKQTMGAGDAALQVMREFQVVPDEIQGIIRGSNRADGQNVLTAAAYWLQMEDEAPQSLNDFVDNDVDVVRAVAANIRAGMTPPDALNAYRRWEAMTPEQKSALKAGSKEIRMNNQETLMERLSDHRNFQPMGFWDDLTWDPEDNIPGFMQSEYDSKVQRYLPTVAYDLKAAQAKAFGDITSKWKVSQINGMPQILKNMPVAPEEDVRTAVTSQFGDKDVRIMSDQLTELQIQNGEKPTYMAFKVVDEETGEVDIKDTRFTWDAQSYAAKKRKKLLEKAKKESKERRELRQNALTNLIERKAVGL